MAKQVAHEIKNPLTPMRLTVQSFQRKFDPTDPNVKQNERLPETLIQQIDTMSAVASVFRILLRCQRNKMKLNVVEVVELAMDIFNEEYIEF
jgi:nitrogen fixation/metabolism regulation signal transduction histidine kinase